jgi:hypothetical protein
MTCWGGLRGPPRSAAGSEPRPPRSASTVPIPGAPDVRLRPLILLILQTGGEGEAGAEGGDRGLDPRSGGRARAVEGGAVPLGCDRRARMKLELYQAHTERGWDPSTGLGGGPPGPRGGHSPAPWKGCRVSTLSLSVRKKCEMFCDSDFSAVRAAPARAELALGDRGSRTRLFVANILVLHGIHSRSTAAHQSGTVLAKVRFQQQPTAVAERVRGPVARVAGGANHEEPVFPPVDG